MDHSALIDEFFTWVGRDQTQFVFYERPPRDIIKPTGFGNNHSVQNAARIQQKEKERENIKK